MKKLCLTFFLIALLGCSESKRESIKGRFDVLEEFYLYDNKHYETGQVLKDKETGLCYLLIWIGHGKAITGIECPEDL